MRQLVTIHPGEILKEEFLDPLGVTSSRLAEELHLPAPSVDALVAGKSSVSADMALRLGRYFNLPAQFWLNLQTEHDLRVARHLASYDEIVPRSA